MIEGFEDKKAAAIEARQMRKHGWPAAFVTELYLPDHPMANDEGDVIVIGIGDEDEDDIELFLHDDGNVK